MTKSEALNRIGVRISLAIVPRWALRKTIKQESTALIVSAGNSYTWSVRELQTGAFKITGTFLLSGFDVNKTSGVGAD